ncbi:hypothetical protein HaLaN_31368, partial [Haematococcus lacustris]
PAAVPLMAVTTQSGWTSVAVGIRAQLGWSSSSLARQLRRGLCWRAMTCAPLMTALSATQPPGRSWAGGQRHRPWPSCT